MVSMWAHIYGEGGLAFKSLGKKNLCFLLLLNSRYSRIISKSLYYCFAWKQRAGGNELSWKGISGLCCKVLLSKLMCSWYIGAITSFTL